MLKPSDLLYLTCACMLTYACAHPPRFEVILEVILIVREGDLSALAESQAGDPALWCSHEHR
jgi:hypothetical protein